MIVQYSDIFGSSPDEVTASVKTLKNIAKRNGEYLEIQAQRPTQRPDWKPPLSVLVTCDNFKLDDDYIKQRFGEKDG